MDPVANIAEQLDIANRILSPKDFERVGDSERLSELVVELDAWRRKGGFDPYTTQRPVTDADRAKYAQDVHDRAWQRTAKRLGIEGVE